MRRLAAAGMLVPAWLVACDTHSGAVGRAGSASAAALLAPPQPTDKLPLPLIIPQAPRCCGRQTSAWTASWRAPARRCRWGGRRGGEGREGGRWLHVPGSQSARLSACRGRPPTEVPRSPPPASLPPTTDQLGVPAGAGAAPARLPLQGAPTAPQPRLSGMHAAGATRWRRVPWSQACYAGAQLPAPVPCPSLPSSSSCRTWSRTARPRTRTCTRHVPPVPPRLYRCVCSACWLYCLLALPAPSSLASSALHRTRQTLPTNRCLALILRNRWRRRWSMSRGAA